MLATAIVTRFYCLQMRDIEINVKHKLNCIAKSLILITIKSAD